MVDCYLAAGTCTLMGADGAGVLRKRCIGWFFAKRSFGHACNKMNGRLYAWLMCWHRKMRLQDHIRTQPRRCLLQPAAVIHQLDSKQGLPATVFVLAAGDWQQWSVLALRRQAAQACMLCVCLRRRSYAPQMRGRVSMSLVR
eukprot:1156514-Pelagomonas_calceolata.AAC.8